LCYLDNFLWEFLAIFPTQLVEQKAGGHMSLKKEFIRDGQRRIIGSITTGYTGSFETLVRDEHEHIIGRTSEMFGTTRDEHGKLVSINTADFGLLIDRKR
jgi:hypothetical protein